MRVNGQVDADLQYCQSYLRIPRLIALISAAIALELGDIIATGTPDGVGVFRKPPVFLKAGDVMEVEIERLWSSEEPYRTGRLNRRFLAGQHPPSRRRGAARQPRPQRRCSQRVPAMGLGGELSRRAFCIFLKDGGEVGRIAKAATLRHLSHVQAWVEERTFGQFHALANQELLQCHTRRPPKDSAQVPGRKMHSLSQLLNRDLGCAAFFHKLADRQHDFVFALAERGSHLLTNRISEAAKGFAGSKRAGSMQYPGDRLLLRDFDPGGIGTDADCRQRQMFNGPGKQGP